MTNEFETLRKFDAGRGREGWLHSLPVLEEIPYFVDAAVPKGASLEKIVDHIEALLEARRAGQISGGSSRKMVPD